MREMLDKSIYANFVFTTLSQHSNRIQHIVYLIMRQVCAYGVSELSIEAYESSSVRHNLATNFSVIITF